MRGGLSGAHGQAGVEEEHSLFGPFLQVSVIGNLKADIAVQFLENILQAGRRADAGQHRETQSVGLVLGPW